MQGPDLRPRRGLDQPGAARRGGGRRLYRGRSGDRRRHPSQPGRPGRRRRSVRHGRGAEAGRRAQGERAAARRQSDAAAAQPRRARRPLPRACSPKACRSRISAASPRRWPTPPATEADPIQLVEEVRQRIGALIVQTIVPVKMPLPVVTLDPSLESLLNQAVRTGQGAVHPIEPGLGQQDRPGDRRGRRAAARRGPPLRRRHLAGRAPRAVAPARAAPARRAGPVLPRNPRQQACRGRRHRRRRARAVRCLNRRSLREFLSSNRARMIAVASGKGGAGKTNVSVNLAVAFARRAAAPCWSIATWGSPMPAILLGLPSAWTIGDLLAGRCALDDLLQTRPRRPRFPARPQRHRQPARPSPPPSARGCWRRCSRYAGRLRPYRDRHRRRHRGLRARAWSPRPTRR